MEQSPLLSAQSILAELSIKEDHHGASTGTKWLHTKGTHKASISPVDGTELTVIKNAGQEDCETIIRTAKDAFLKWRLLPAPARGEIVRQIGTELRKKKDVLGALVSLEMGKILEEGKGEVQEMIDMCDFAVGLSRQLYGLTIQSERPQHRMSEQWHPLGPVAVITAFNFPVAVWAWNAMLAAVCGDTIIWKPSSKTPLCAIAVHNIISKVLKKNNVPEGVFNLVIGNSKEIGYPLISDNRIPLVSVTGSVPTGKYISQIVGKRLGKCIAELGGNNGIIISKHANLKLAVPAIVFGAVGTTGQRCTSTRRLIIDKKIYDSLVDKLITAYQQIEKRIGNPLDPATLVGPLIDKFAVDDYKKALSAVEAQGGKILYGNKILSGKGYQSGNYVLPTITEVENSYPIVQAETFAPILHLIRYQNFEQAIDLHNGVPQGLSSAIFTDDLREAELFLSSVGSDCGIANVNIGTSGAEIGGAFGGEKDTGGGRESGSDAWKSYMRRQTSTVNFGTDIPLAQGIKFDF